MCSRAILRFYQNPVSCHLNKKHQSFTHPRSSPGRNACTELPNPVSSADVTSKILEAGPILESLGNAKTLRNNNSSRFGKWIALVFDSSSCIASCSINCYLLEKSRIVRPASLLPPTPLTCISGAEGSWRAQLPFPVSPSSCQCLPPVL
jgi:hypothetical protein